MTQGQPQPTPRPSFGRIGGGFLPVARIALLAFACCMAFIFQISHWPQWWRTLFGIGGWWLIFGAGIASYQALRQQPLRITRPGWRSAAGYVLLIVSGALAGHLIVAAGHPAVGLLVLAAGTGAGIPLWADMRWNALTELVGAWLEQGVQQLTEKLPFPRSEADPASTQADDPEEADTIETPLPAPVPAASATPNLRAWFTRTWSAPEHVTAPDAESPVEVPDAPAPTVSAEHDTHQAALARAAEKLDTRHTASVNTVPAGSPLPVITLDKPFQRPTPAPAPKPLPVLGLDQVLQPPRYLSRQPEERPAPAPKADLPRIDANEIRARLQSMHGHRDTQRITTQNTRPVDQTTIPEVARATATPTPIVVRGSRTVSNAEDAVFISARRPVQRAAVPPQVEEPVESQVMPAAAPTTQEPQAEPTLAPRYQSGRALRTAQSYTVAPVPDAAPVPTTVQTTPTPAVEPAPMAPRPFWQRPQQAADASPVAPDLVLPEMPAWQAPEPVTTAELAVAAAPAPVFVDEPHTWPAIQEVPLPAIEQEPAAERPTPQAVITTVIMPAAVAVGSPVAEPVASPAFTPMRWQPMPWEEADEVDDAVAEEPAEETQPPEAAQLPAAPAPAVPVLAPWQNSTASIAEQVATSGEYQPSAWASELINRPAPVPAPPPRPLYDESCLPGLDLLQPPAQAIDPISQDELIDRGIVIEEKLAEFKVKVSVLDAFAGPVITRYEVEPAVGVRGAQVVNLMKDLARALGLVSIRVVETIPGKTCMGLELPNPTRQMIRLSEILGAEEFFGSHSKLTMALGKDITGKPVVTDLAKAPHMLVAGTTGSGKSVGVNAMILSLL
ncbi:DNA translocase FtsK, partial [Silvimonas amylolytica]|uniref:DNA translocase FtsK n=1 Tax=Silvimonas amylolytica TaxID=449663 RepID=UPI00227BF977